MALNLKILPQSSFGLSGYWGLQESLTIPFYNYESNSSNYFGIKDWGISLQYGAEFSGSVNTSLYLLAIVKKLGNHSLSARFTPGYQKEFLFATGEAIIINDTTTQSLEANYNYKELFGFGYSYAFNEQFSAGLAVRFFNQNFNQQIVKPVFGDTLYLVRETLDEKVNMWNADIGIDFILSKQFQFRAASINLFNYKDEIMNEEFQKFQMEQKRGALLIASYLPADYLNLHFLYETTSSFQVSLTGLANRITYGLTAFHDYYQEPYIAGIIPAVGYRTSLFEILVSGVKYFSDRTTNSGFSKFYEEGIHNIINNRYSFDKIVLSLAVNVSSTPEKKVELIGVEIVRDIYPAFYDKYINEPFAYGKVVNISDKAVSVIPSVRIEGVTEDKIQSPPQMIAAKDTATVPFYLIIPDKYFIDKTMLSYADFYITASSTEPDAQLQKAALINSMNSWDGNVANLRYFIIREMEYSMNISKKILSENKTVLDTIPSDLSAFYKSKFIFNDFVKKLVYTSDPRATAEYVQFPKQTLELKGGDCDDLSVAYSSLLESVGVQTALVDYKGDGEIRHVNVLVNTGLEPARAKLITNNDSKYFIRKNELDKDEVWIPVETTSLTNFDEAWNIGVEKFNSEAIENLGLVKNKVEIIDVY
ncbi:MAG: hypothetical protein HXY48_12540 [Ignavibacteriaceae bacterium]|nr:hypothetical protein [Ignavibacteriaceae bacterium]